MFLGTICGVGLALFLEVIDVNIKSTEDIEKYVDWPVIGIIPKAQDHESRSIGKYVPLLKEKRSEATPSDLILTHEVQSPIAEAFRMLRTNIQVAQSSSSHQKTIMVTSSHPQEGKSFIAANLAIVTAEMGIKTLLIDADLRKPSIHSLFDQEIKPGVVDLLAALSKPRKQSKGSSQKSDRNRSLNNAIKKMIRKTDIPNLSVITSGEIPPNPSELLASKYMTELNKKLSARFDCVVYDFPPVLPVADAVVMATKIDRILFVIEKGRAKPSEIIRAKDLMERSSHGQLIGAVLNNVDAHDGYYSYYHYKRGA